jgi:hypothetical protein
MSYDSRPETYKHIQRVQHYMGIVVRDLTNRLLRHDQSKLSAPELSAFDEFTPKLSECTYNSEQYKGYLAAMRPALNHHYAKNDHHPEYFEEGIQGMDLIQLIEMICDWCAAVERHKDGDIQRSIAQNKERFGYSDELRQILSNTARSIQILATHRSPGRKAGNVTELERIERQHRNCSPHIKQRQTWKDMDALLAVARAAEKWAEGEGDPRTLVDDLERAVAALSALAGKEKSL